MIIGGFFHLMFLRRFVGVFLEVWVCSGPKRSRHQDRVRSARDLLGQMTLKDTGEKGQAEAGGRPGHSGSWAPWQGGREKETQVGRASGGGLRRQCSPGPERAPGQQLSLEQSHTGELARPQHSLQAQSLTTACGGSVDMFKGAATGGHASYTLHGGSTKYKTIRTRKG